MMPTLTHFSDISCLEKMYIVTHRGRGTHLCADKLNIIGSDNGLSPGEKVNNRHCSAKLGRIICRPSRVRVHVFK